MGGIASAVAGVLLDLLRCEKSSMGIEYTTLYSSNILVALASTLYKSIKELTCPWHVRYLLHKI